MPVQEFYVDLDLKGRTIKGAKIEVVDSTSAVQVGGFGIVGDKLYYNNGTATVEVADASVVTTIRTELGTKPESAKSDIYTRLKAVEDAIGNDTGGNNLVTRVGNLETKVNDETSGLAKTKEIADGAATAAAAAQSTAKDAKTKAETNETAITGLGTRVKTAEDKITALETSVGKAAAGEEPATGLYKSIADVKAVADKNKTDLADVKKVADAAATKTYVDDELAKKVDKAEGSRLMTTAEGTKLEGIDAGAQVNVIDMVTIDGTEATISGKTAAFTLKLSEYAKKADIGTAYVYKGSVNKIAELPPSSEESPVRIGDVYNLNEEFTYDGKKYPAGTNVAWNGTKWDPLGGTVDFSAYLTKTQVETKISDATKDLATSETVTTELAKKVDKLETKPTAGTYAKVTINAEGQVTAGTAKITEADIDGSIAATKLSGTIDKARLPTDIPASSIDGVLSSTNIPAISLAGEGVTGVLPAAKLGLAVVTLAFTAGTDQSVAHGLGSVPYFVQAVDAAGNTIDGVTITRDATNIRIQSGAEHPALTVYAIGLRA